MPRHRLTFAEFCEAVREAVEGLPEPFRPWLENVVVDVQEEPSKEDLQQVEDELVEVHGEDDLQTTESEGEGEPLLLGLFVGTPITEQHFNERPMNRIKIYRRPMEEISRTRKELIKNIRDTVLHELAHHFGYDEEDLEDFEASR